MFWLSILSLHLSIVSLHHDPTDATVKDMEAAAIAWTANLYDTPFMAVKVVTDIVDGGRPTQEEFFENLATAAASLQITIPKLIDYVVGKKLNEL